MARSLYLPLLILVGCAGQKRAAEPGVPPLDDIEIRVAGVGIGEPCTAVTCAKPAVALALRNGTQPAKVRLLRVTIMGDGRTLDLPAKAPTVFASTGNYEPWNETIGSEEVMAIHYDLERVDWDHFENPLEVRAIYVVVEVDGRERFFSVPEYDATSVIVDDVAAN